MPVDTSAINTILGAYAQGAQIRQRQEAQKFAEQEAIARQTLQRQQLEEETKRAEAALKQRQEEQKATATFRDRQLKMQEAANKLAQVGAKSQVAEHIQKTGITPAGFKREIDWISPDAQDVYFKYTAEDDPTFSFVLPSQITHARNQSAIQEELLQPQLKMEAQKAQARAVTEATKQTAAHNSRMLIEQERTKRQEAHDNREYENRLKVANIKASRAKTPQDKEAAQLSKPLTREDVAELNRANPEANLKFGMTWGDAKGLNVLPKLSATQQKDKEFLDSIESAAMQLLPLVKENKDYFAGAGLAGGISEGFRKITGETSKKTANMKAVLGRITAVVGNKFFGASFTGGEDQRIRAFVPRETKDQNYDDVVANLNELLNYTREVRARMFGGAASSQKAAESLADRYGGGKK